MNRYYVKAYSIVGYIYQADIYCPSCILHVLPTGEGEAFDGWKDVSGTMTAEENLDELAAAFGIDRYNEESFDSGEFPKVVFASDSPDDYCGRCDEYID